MFYPIYRDDEEFEEYLSALPADIQHELQNSRLKIKSLDELIDYAENMMTDYY